MSGDRAWRPQRALRTRVGAVDFTLRPLFGRALLAGTLLTGTLLAGALLGCGGGDGATATAEPTVAPSAEAKVVPVATRLTVSREVVDKTSLPADLLPLKRAVLAAEVAGAIEAITVEEGDRVRTGQVLATVDTRTLRQQLAEATAVAQHREELFQRAEKLLAKQSITQQQVLDAIAERDVAAAQLETARLMLEKSRIKAPWSGTVAARRVEVGDYVMPSQAVIELLDVGRLKVRSPAPASDVPYLRVGLPAEVRLDVFPGEVFSGKVTRLAAELDPSARTLDIEVEIANDAGRLRPGMYAGLEIPRRVLPAAILVPLAAVVELENERVVYVVVDQRAMQRRVELGMVVGEEVVVREGLAAGERIIVEGQQRVSPGQSVTLASEG